MTYLGNNHLISQTVPIVVIFRHHRAAVRLLLVHIPRGAHFWFHCSARDTLGEFGTCM